MIVFPIGNASITWWTAHFLFENRPMIDFQIGNVATPRVSRLLIACPILNALITCERVHFLFENRLMIVVPIGNASITWWTAHFLFENRPMTDFQIGNERHERSRAHSLLEKRPMIDFQEKNGEGTKAGTGMENRNGKWEWRICNRRAPPPGRPQSLLLPWPGTFAYTHLPTHTAAAEFDFIDPDCHLLGKKTTKI